MKPVPVVLIVALILLLISGVTTFYVGVKAPLGVVGLAGILLAGGLARREFQKRAIARRAAEGKPIQTSPMALVAIGAALIAIAAALVGMVLSGLIKNDGPELAAGAGLPILLSGIYVLWMGVRAHRSRKP